MVPRNHRLGFSLIEVLLTAGILAVVAGITLVALNPRENILGAYDAERHAHVNALIKSMNDYHWEKHEMLKGNSIPSGTSGAKPICKQGTAENACTASGGVSLALLVPDYLVTLPQDSAEPCPIFSGFKVYQDAGRAMAVATHLGVMPGEATGGCAVGSGTPPPPPPSAGITVNPVSGLTTTEAGGTATFTMVLNAAPTSSVSISVDSGDTTEDLVSDGTTIAASITFTFTASNWSIAQTITLIGQDDALADGNIAVTIKTQPAVSADPAYSGMNAADVSVTNTDNEPALPTCNGLTATIYVNGSNIIVGGPDNGETYDGELEGTSGTDVIVGTNNDDEIDGKGGTNTICGLGGNDEIDGESGNDYIDGGDGNDEIDGSNGTNTLIGGSGNNTITGGSGDDTITSGAGNDVINAGNGNNTINAGDGNNTVNCGSGTDNVTTGSGNDDIDVGSAADTVNAGSGNDDVEGGSGNDTLDGGAGTDTLDGGANTDACTNGETVSHCE